MVKLKIQTPENILGVPKPKLLWHYGTCDCCKKKFVLVLHFGYDTQPKRDYRICGVCLGDNILVLFRLQNQSRKKSSIPPTTVGILEATL